MIYGKNILCFGSENWEYPGFQQTLMRKLSKSNRIIFVNPLGSRKITLHYSQLQVYLRRIKNTFIKTKSPKQNCLVCSPWIIPLVYNKIVIRFNKQLIQCQFKSLLTKNNFRPYILWIGTPTAAFLVDQFKPDLLVYNPVDRYSAFSFVDKISITNFEKKISSKADVIICTAEAIQKDLSAYNTRAYTVNHAVDTDHFNPYKEYAIPHDLIDIKKPIVGFVGGLADWVDYNLLFQVANRLPNVNLVLIGKRYDSVDFNFLLRKPNVFWFGHKNFNDLPKYLNRFSACLIPYIINSRLLAVDPIKLREYLAMGKPIVSVDLPEVRKFQKIVYIAKTENEFVEQVNFATNENNVKLFERRIATAHKNNWQAKLKEISNLIQPAMENRTKLAN